MGGLNALMDDQRRYHVFHHMAIALDTVTEHHFSDCSV